MEAAVIGCAPKVSGEKLPRNPVVPAAEGLVAVKVDGGPPVLLSK